MYDYGKEITNSPPNNPTCVYDKTANEIILVAVDPDNNMIRYGVSWGNNQIVNLWTDYFNSSLEVRVGCGIHKDTVGVIAEDIYGGQSEWVSVTPKSKQHMNIIQFIWQQFLSRFPFLSEILKTTNQS